MNKLILSLLFVLKCALSMAAINDSTTKNIYSISFSSGKTFKISKNQVLKIQMPLWVDNITSTLSINIQQHNNFILTYAKDMYRKDDGKFSIQYSKQSLFIGYGIERYVQKLYIRNDFGFGYSNYEYQLFNKNNIIPIDSFYDKFGYLANYLSSPLNYSLKYGTNISIANFISENLNIIISQNLYFNLKRDEIFCQSFKSRFSESLLIGVQFFFR